MLLITNDAQKARTCAGDAASKHQQEIEAAVRHEYSNSVFIDNKLIDPTNNEKQMGKPLAHWELEKRLRTVLPSRIIFIDNPWLPDKRACVRILNNPNSINGTYETLCPYGKGILPEHSILRLEEIEVPDPDIISRRKSLNRKDLGQYEYISGEGFKFAASVKPGYIKKKIPGSELTRGWRTVVLRLVQVGVLTLTDAERLFGSDDSPGWAQSLKGHTRIVPW